MALMTWVFVVLILLVVLVLVVLKVTRGSTAATIAPDGDAAPGAVVDAVTSIPTSVFDAVGAPSSGTAEGPQVLGPSSPELQRAGLPLVDFVGADYSPYSAAASWAVVAAMSRFGNFAHLDQSQSAQLTVFPSVASFSFAKSTTFSSAVVSFRATEEYANTVDPNVPGGYMPMSALSSQDAALLARYDTPGAAGANLPFIDVAGRVLVVGEGIGFSPGILEKQSMAQVAGELGDPTSAVAKAVLGLADELSAAICSVTSQSPATVCDSPAVRAGAQALGSG